MPLRMLRFVRRACPSASTSSMMGRLALPRDMGVWQWKRYGTGLFWLGLWTSATVAMLMRRNDVL